MCKGLLFFIMFLFTLPGIWWLAIIAAVAWFFAIYILTFIITRVYRTW